MGVGIGCLIGTFLLNLAFLIFNSRLQELLILYIMVLFGLLFPVSSSSFFFFGLQSCIYMKKTFLLSLFFLFILTRFAKVYGHTVADGQNSRDKPSMILAYYIGAWVNNNCFFKYKNNMKYGFKCFGFGSGLVVEQI
jgi:hypothetical protein